jgi:hypothetical protein
VKEWFSVTGEDILNADAPSFGISGILNVWNTRDYNKILSQDSFPFM